MAIYLGRPGSINSQTSSSMGLGESCEIIERIIRSNLAFGFLRELLYKRAVVSDNGTTTGRRRTCVLSCLDSAEPSSRR